MSRAGPGMGGAGRGLLDGVGEDREDAPTPPNPPLSRLRAERVGRWRPLVSPRVPFSAVASLCFSLSPPGFQFSGPGSPRPAAREPGRGRSGGSRRREGRTEKTIGAPRRDPRRRRGAVTRGLPDARQPGRGRPPEGRAGRGQEGGAPLPCGWLGKGRPRPPHPPKPERERGLQGRTRSPGRGSPGVRGPGGGGGVGGRGGGQPSRSTSRPAEIRFVPRAQGASWPIPLTTQGG